MVERGTPHNRPLQLSSGRAKATGMNGGHGEHPLAAARLDRWTAGERLFEAFRPGAMSVLRDTKFQDFNE